MQATTAAHTYQLTGRLQIWKDGSQLTTVELSGAIPSVQVPNLAPGSYGLYLEWPGFILKDGVQNVAATLTSPNPGTVEIVAGAAASYALSFAVAGDPSTEPPDPSAVGTLILTIAINEVTP